MARRPRSRRGRLRGNIQDRLDRANAGGGGGPYSNKPVDEIDANAQMSEDRDSGTGGGPPISNEPAPGTTGGNEMLMPGFVDPTTITSSWINPSRENVGTGLSRGPKEPDKPRADPNALYQTTDASLDNYVHESWINDWTKNPANAGSPTAPSFSPAMTIKLKSGQGGWKIPDEWKVAWEGWPESSGGGGGGLLDNNVLSNVVKATVQGGANVFETVKDEATTILDTAGINEESTQQVLETTTNILDSAEEKTDTLLTAATTATTEVAGSLGETLTGTSNASQITTNPEDLGEVATTGMETLTGNIDAGVENLNRAYHTGVESLNTLKDDVISTANDVKDFVLDPFGTINRAYTEGVDNTNVWIDQVKKIWNMATGGGGGVTDNVPQVDSELMSQASSVATRSGGFWDESQGGGGGAQSFMVQRRKKGPETLLTRGQTRGKIRQRMMAA